MSKSQLNLQSLSIEQLQGLKAQFEGDIESLTRALDGLRGARGRFADSKAQLETYKTLASASQMMVPLTSSLYVMGEVRDTQHVLVDVGTGYYIRQSVPRAQAFFEKRANQMRESMESIGAAIDQKKNQSNSVIEILQAKLQMQRQEGQE